MRRIAGVVAILVVLAFSIVIPAYAVEEVVEQETNTVKPAEGTSLEEKKKALEEKKAEKKKELEVKAQEKAKAIKEKRIQAKCQASQEILRGVHTGAESIKANRKKIYTKLSEKIDNLLPKIKATGIDVTKLEADSAQLKTLLGEIDTNFDIYTEELSDATKVNCQEDPAGFYKSLETARGARVSLADSINEVKEFVNGVIKPELQNIKSQLENNKQTTEPNAEESSNTNNEQTGE